MFLVVLVYLVLPTNVSAEIQSLPPQKVGTCVNIAQTCSNCTYVNIDSVTYPNLTKTYLNTAMSNEGYGYSYSFCDTWTLGDYIVATCGDVDGIVTCINYDFPVTPTGGPESNTLIFLVSIISAVVLLIISFIFKNHIFAFLSGLTFLGAGLYTTAYGFGLITSDHTRILAGIILGLGMIITIVSALEFMEDLSGEDESYDDNSEEEF